MATYEGVDLLALEAAAALKAGMSYGKWKAMGGEVEAEWQLPDGWKICKHCKTPFKPKKAVRQAYCNPDCQYEAQKEKESMPEPIRQRKRQWLLNEWGRLRPPLFYANRGVYRIKGSLG